MKSSSASYHVCVHQVNETVVGIVARRAEKVVDCSIGFRRLLFELANDRVVTACDDTVQLRMQILEGLGYPHFRRPDGESGILIKAAWIPSSHHPTRGDGSNAGV